LLGNGEAGVVLGDVGYPVVLGGRDHHAVDEGPGDLYVAGPQAVLRRDALDLRQDDLGNFLSLLSQGVAVDLGRKQSG
jgi:hypothetical protein